ncbi:hypothetical protein OSSY52_08110 [Tepiditoga spiralis]|uniref:Uncharacterized protein n=1 Tax=Tepiditoga spiralis TaxID=2108365 RepID=A0A7G1G2R2_9BACT|nr:hypothetical protein [Tepiditoga spiralis]BBE30670.1 hypothetical protein OSSY52_08110 [Tepiditoga spiralis]
MENLKGIHLLDTVNTNIFYPDQIYEDGFMEDKINECTEEYLKCSFKYKKNIIKENFHGK